MPFVNYQLKLPEEESKEVSDRAVIAGNIIESILPSKDSLFSVNYTKNVITKDVGKATHTIVNDEDEGKCVLLSPPTKIDRKKKWRSNPENRLKESKKRKSRQVINLGKENAIQRAARLKREADSKRRRRAAARQAAMNLSLEGDIDVNFASLPSSGKSLNPFYRRSQAESQYTLVHTIERTERHYFTHHHTSVKEGGNAIGYLFAVKNGAENRAKVVNVTEVADNRHSPFSSGPVSAESSIKHTQVSSTRTSSPAHRCTTRLDLVNRIPRRWQ